MSAMRRRRGASWGALTLVLLLFAAGAARAAAQPVVIGIVLDGERARSAVSLERIQREMRALLQPEFEPRFPAEKQVDGGWDLAATGAALDRLLRDEGVDVVLTLGVAGSHLAAQRPVLSKAVIAASVADARLQGFPLVEGVSGKAGFTYLASFRSLESDLTAFHGIVGFDHLAVLVDALTLEAIPALRAKAGEVARLLDVTVDVVPVTASARAALDRLPAGTDAVYVTPLLRLDDAELGRLAEGLVARRIASFSLLGRAEVEAGLMLTTGGDEADASRYARRIALDVQRVLLGEDPGGIEVAFTQTRRLAINMATARELGFLPRWSVLVDALQIDGEVATQAPPLSLVGAMLEAADSNLGLRAAELSVRIAEDAVDLARAPLRPQLDASATRRQIDADRANPLTGAERTTEAGVGLSQVIYAEELRAGLAVSRFLKTSQDYGYTGAVLDTMRAAATAYLNVLRAKALEGVRGSNLEVTRTNLELARVREAIGISGRGDVLRWESELAIDKQDLLATQADRESAEVELRRVLNRPQTDPLAVSDAGVREPLAVMQDRRFTRFIDNPIVWETFQEFIIAEALRQAPELAEIDALQSAQQRDLLARKRAFYVPQVSLGGNAARTLSRGGVGSDVTGTGIDDDAWDVGVQLSLPLFAGGARRAARAQSAHALDQIRVQRDDVAQRVEARTRAALQQTGGSYPAIELSGEAARAAGENLALITDAYSKGAVSITDVVNAQDAALSARLAAAEARYAFLIDYVEVVRASGSFDLLLDRAGLEDWFQRLEQYFAERGVQPLPPE